MKKLLKIACLLISLLAAPSCSKNSAEAPPAVPVQIVAVQQATLNQTVTADAILFPLQQSAITPKISAPVKAFHVKRASRVHKGQLLATLENRDLAAAAQENKGAYEQAEAAYATTTAADLPQEMQKAQLDLQSAQRLYEAQQKVYDSRKDLYQQGAMPRKEFDQAGVDLTNARNQYEMAQKHFDALNAIGKQQTLKSAAGQLESAKGKFLGAEAQFSYSEILSPIDGVITDRPLYPGEMASAKALDPNSTTVEVWVQAKNPGQHLKPGTSVKLSMLAQSIPDALVIPAAGLLIGQDGSTSVMQIGADNHAHQKTVRVGIRQGDQIQITEGLKAGDKIVGSGAYGLPDNTAIKPEETTAGATP